MLSIVIPVFNEEDNIEPMVEAIREAVGDLPHEIVFVDDGSSDGTVERINAITGENICVVVFARNYGQTSAMAAGIEASRGEFIATLDGDLQNDPADIPMMLEKLQTENLDIVMGRRANRKDGMVLRKIPSKIANWLIRRTTGVHISDYGCTLKVFRWDIAKQLELYGELHRFIPLLSAMHGAKFEEVDVHHHARRFGTSKYGLGRTFRVLSDLLLMLFFLKYRQKPMHLFGTIGTGFGLLGGLALTYLLILKIMGEDIGTRPLFFVGILFIITGIQFICTGFLAELNMRTYFESQKKKPYLIQKVFENGREISFDQ